ncbi:MAG: hypothetical protein MR517_00450 [Bacteroidales bacterium]|nr:hypothetical protein [Bacteroidales bacterium]
MTDRIWAIPEGVCNFLFPSFGHLHEEYRPTPPNRLSVQEKSVDDAFPERKKGIPNKAVPTFFFIFAAKTGLKNLKGTTASPIARLHDCPHALQTSLWDSNNNRPPAHLIYL